MNASLVAGLSLPYTVMVSGSNLYVANFSAGTIGEYTTSGAVVNASLSRASIGPFGMAMSGSNLFVGVYGTETISEYTTSGVL